MENIPCISYERKRDTEKAQMNADFIISNATLFANLIHSTNTMETSLREKMWIKPKKKKEFKNYPRIEILFAIQ